MGRGAVRTWLFALVGLAATAFPLADSVLAKEPISAGWQKRQFVQAYDDDDFGAAAGLRDHWVRITVATQEASPCVQTMCTLSINLDRLRVMVRVEPVDLNDDGVLEYLLRSTQCEATGCPYALVMRRSGVWRDMLNPLTAQNVVVDGERTGTLRSLSVTSQRQGYDVIDYTTYVWDGVAYVPRASGDRGQSGPFGGTASGGSFGGSSGGTSPAGPFGPPSRSSGEGPFGSPSGGPPTPSAPSRPAYQTQYSITPASATMGEADGSFMFQLTRVGDRPAETVYVSTVIGAKAGFAVNANDYKGKRNEPIVFKAGEPSQPITLILYPEDLDDGDKTFGLMVESTPGTDGNTVLAKAQFTVRDDDDAGVPLAGAPPVAGGPASATPSQSSFLIFPLECAVPTERCNQPYSAGAFTPGMINSILDHSMRPNPGTGNLPYGRPAGDGRDVITAFSGESADGEVFDTNCLGGRIALRPSPGSAPLTNASGCRGDPNYAAYDDHPGYDYRAATGTPVRAAAAGRILNINGSRCHIGNMDYTCEAWGFVGVAHSNGYVSQYGHLSRVLVGPGEEVIQGQIIGYSGSTAPPDRPITGPHLHFEVWKVVGGKYYLVDPYGWQGDGQDPLASATMVPPARLWITGSSKPSSQEASVPLAGAPPVGSGPASVQSLEWAVRKGFEDAAKAGGKRVLSSVTAAALHTLLSQLPDSMIRLVSDEDVYNRLQSALAKKADITQIQLHELVRKVIVDAIADALERHVRESGIPGAELWAAASKSTLEHASDIVFAGNPEQALASTLIRSTTELTEMYIALAKLNVESAQFSDGLVRQGRAYLLAMQEATALRAAGQDIRADRIESAATSLRSQTSRAIQGLSDFWKPQADVKYKWNIVELLLTAKVWQMQGKTAQASAGFENARVYSRNIDAAVSLVPALPSTKYLEFERAVEQAFLKSSLRPQ